MKKIALFIFIFAFILFRPYELKTGGFWYNDDDWDYFAHASSIVYGQFPSYENEFFEGDGERPLGTIGSGLMAAPFVFVFSLLDRVMDAPIVAERTQQNIPGSWSHFGFIFSSVFYLWISCFLLHQVLLKFYKEPVAVWTVILIVLCQGLPLYVFRRPIFSHVYEFFLQSFLIYVLVRLSKAEIQLSFKNIFVIGAAVSLTVLVRMNNVFMALLWPLLLCIDHISDWTKWSKLKKLIGIYFVSFLIVLLFQVMPEYYGSSVSYDGDIRSRLLEFHSLGFYLKRLWYVFAGANFGLIYSAPFVVIGIGAAFIHKYPLKTKILISLLPMMVNLYCILAWKSQGGWYGYRYLIFAITPLLVIPFADFIKFFSLRVSVWRWILSLLACFPALSMSFFAGSVKMMNLTVIESAFGQTAWDNLFYQMDIWEIVVVHPLEGVMVLLDAGGFYFLNLFTQIVNVQHLLPSLIARNYLFFDISVLIKTLIIYSFIFGLNFVFKKKVKNESII